MFTNILAAEFIKVRRSGTPYVLLGGPTLLALLVFAMMTGPRPAHSWEQLLSGTAQIWTLLILPLNATMFAASYGQIEHRAHGWDFLAAIPVDRWKIYLAKIIVALIGVLVLQFLFLFSVITSGGIASVIFHKALGDLALAAALRANAMVWVASLLMVAIQLWASFRLSNFIAPVMVGMTGTILTITAVLSHRSEAAYLPWAFPGLTFSPPGIANTVTLLASLIGAAVVLLLMTVDLTRQEIK